MTVTIAPWAADAPAGLAGSLTAVPAEQRTAAVRALAAAGLGVHLDVVLDADGHRRGVPVGDWAAVREAAPGAVVDVHVILLPGADGASAHAAVAAAFATAASVGAVRLSADPELLARHADAVAHLRRGGVAVWQALPPGTDAPDPSAPCDGVLVMLIEPGTARSADPGRIALVERLAPSAPVGVDGGVDADLASRAAAAGAAVVVSGRALLRVADDAPPAT